MSVSGDAMCVLAGVPSFDLLTEERLRESNRRKNERMREPSSVPSEACKGKAKVDMRGRGGRKCRTCNF